MELAYYLRCVVMILGFYHQRLVSTSFVQSQYTRTWHALPTDSPVNQTELEVVVTESIMLCTLMVTSIRPFQNILCFRIGSCMYGSLPLESMQGDRPQGYDCYYTSTCFVNDDVLLENQVIPDPECPGLDSTCSDGKLVHQGAVPNPRPSCTSPFTQYTFGCMHFNTTRRDMRASVEFCESLGANLASLKTGDDFDDLRNYLMHEFGDKDDFWVHVNYDNGVWKWPINGREVDGPFIGDAGSAHSLDGKATLEKDAWKCLTHGTSI